MAPFTPSYIASGDLATFGLPLPDVQTDIMNLVGVASYLIDEECGRIDGDGSGSLVYTAYTQRLILQTRNRNLFMLPLKPIVGLDSGTISSLQAAASGTINTVYTGAVANTIFKADGTLSGIISASGRYGYTRQDMAVGYPDLYATINPLNLVTIFGGPPPWVGIDISNIDYDPKTGECWIPAGLQLQRYSEVLISYNSGFNPLNMPYAIKYVCAAVVKNLLAKGGGTTALTSIRLGGGSANVGLLQGVIDPTLDRMLMPYKSVRAY